MEFQFFLDVLYLFIARFVVSDPDLACSEGYTNHYNCWGTIAFRNNYVCSHLPKKNKHLKWHSIVMRG